MTSQVTINKDLTIDGSGVVTPTISGTGTQPGGCTGRLFSITSGKNVTLNRLNIVNGFARYYPDYPCKGGAIYNTGTLTVTNSIFSNNSANYGGAIFSEDYSTVTVSNSTFRDNSATDDGWGGGGGGAISREAEGTLTVTNSTFSHNTRMVAAASAPLGSRRR